MIIAIASCQNSFIIHIDPPVSHPRFQDPKPGTSGSCIRGAITNYFALVR